jgi:hypothetical protein
MQSKKESTDARVHTSRDDSDGGAAESGRPRRGAKEKARETFTCRCGATLTAEENTCEACGKTTAWHEGLDGVHPREA